MNTPYPRIVFYTVLLLFVFNSGLPVQGQDADPEILYKESLQHFQEGNYRTALEGFILLKQRQPENVLNFYYAGRCLVELNERLDDAIEYLYSASKRGAPADAEYYLGMAYHRDYNFSEARKYYSRFELEASRQQLKDMRVNHMINTCRSALQITATYNQYEVMTVTFLNLEDSLAYSQIRMKGGQLQKKPAAYFSLDEDRGGLGSLMFMPYSPQRGDYIYYSGPGKPDKEGTQLFRVKKGTGKSWGDPQEIKALNTEGDELLPYYDPIENDLYYASNGGEGVGGFDLFRAHYDVERDEWTEAINLGFPINSAMDEFLLLPGSDLGMMMFFSNRQGTDSTLTVYRVHLVEPKLKTDANDNRKLREIANLNGAANEILAEIGAINQKEEAMQNVDIEEPVRERIPKAPSTAYTRVKIVASDETAASVTSSERSYLSEALKHQAASDSLKDLADGAHARVRESEDPNDRWVWQKQIMVWEKKAREEEEKADNLFAAHSQESMEETLAQADTEPADLEGEPGTQPAMNVITPASASVTYMNRFDILSSSPYTSYNAIPMDLPIPDGIFYRIQLGAYAQAVEPGTFDGISPITGETLKERGLIKYYAGKFTKYDDASTALSRVRSKGFEDAFVSAWYNGSPISTQKAKQLE